MSDWSELVATHSPNWATDIALFDAADVDVVERAHSQLRPDPVDPDSPDQQALTDPATLAAHLDNRYVRRAHTDLIGQELRTLADSFRRRRQDGTPLQDGEFDRLAINLPPQVGKTFTTVEWGAFWWLCLFPTAHIIIGSYGDDLAVKRGKAIRKLITLYGPRYGLFLEPGSTSMKDWSLTSGGGVRSVGVGSGITGNPGDLIFIDDPIKSRAEAESGLRRQVIHDWYSADILSRQSPACPVVLLMTPWHPDDLRARVIADEGRIEEGGRWKVVVMPAVCTDPVNDPLGRAEGDPLPHPRLPDDRTTLLDHWQKIRDSLASAIRDWFALWMCDPKPVEGSLLRWETIRAQRCYQAGSPSEPCELGREIVAVSIDPSGGGRNTAGVGAGYLGTDKRLYLTHDRTAVMTSDAWARVACELAVEVDADRFVVERNFGGDMAALTLRTAWEALRREQPDRFGMLVPRIVEVTARRGKLLRAEPIAQQWIEDKVRTTAFMPEFESEWASWQPGGDSPGRIDWSVHLAYELLPMPASGASSAVGAALLSESSLLPWGRR